MSFDFGTPKGVKTEQVSGKSTASIKLILEY